MRKILKRIKDKWQVLLVTGCILAIFSGFIFYLDWAWDVYGRDYALSLASFFIATVVALVVIYSLKLTRDSLELTRTTTRPFLTFSDVTYEPISDSGNPEIRLILHNTGALPTGGISVEYELRLLSTEGHKLIHDTQKQPPLFPNEKRVSAFLLPQMVKGMVLADTDTKPLLTVRIEYTLSKEYFHTERTLSLPPGVYTFDNQFIFLVIHGRDYWH